MLVEMMQHLQEQQLQQQLAPLEHRPGRFHVSSSSGDGGLMVLVTHVAVTEARNDILTVAVLLLHSWLSSFSLQVPHKRYKAARAEHVQSMS